MFLAFFYDLSQYDPNLVINIHGLPTWAPSGLPGPSNLEEFVRINWWIRGDCLRYIIRVDDNPAGYLIICNKREHLTPEVDFELVDFYIAPKYRRQGVGRIAARLAFDTQHGVWQVFELAANTPALKFWHDIIGEYIHGQYTDLDGGTQQRFRN